jgi:PadR family transcriptional regulator, regulatory protein PadR
MTGNVRIRRISTRMLAVIGVLMDEDNGPWYGLRIAEKLGTSTGQVYPVLARLEQAGWVTGRWEQDHERQPRSGGRRRYVALTDEGRGRATAALSARQQQATRAQRAAALLRRATGGAHFG